MIQSLITNRCALLCFDSHFVSQNGPQIVRHLKNSILIWSFMEIQNVESRSLLNIWFLESTIISIFILHTHTHLWLCWYKQIKGWAKKCHFLGFYIAWPIRSQRKFCWHPKWYLGSDRANKSLQLEKRSFLLSLCMMRNLWG